MGALLAFSAVTLEGDRPAQTPEMRPNVVVVMTDDQTVEQVQALRRFRGLIGRAGTTFTRNFATFPWCCPSRATYLTGQYSHNHRVRGNRPPAGGVRLRDPVGFPPEFTTFTDYAEGTCAGTVNGKFMANERVLTPGSNAVVIR